MSYDFLFFLCELSCMELSQTVRKNDPRFLVIILRHTVGELPGWMEMVATNLPELPKPSRTLGKNQELVI